MCIRKYIADEVSNLVYMCLIKAVVHKVVQFYIDEYESSYYCDTIHIN
jgi:hypothetical protein